MIFSAKDVNWDTARRGGAARVSEAAESGNGINGLHKLLNWSDFNLPIVRLNECVTTHVSRYRRYRQRRP